MNFEKKYKFEIQSKKVLEDEEALILYNEKDWKIRTLSNLSIGGLKYIISMGEKEHSICLKKEKNTATLNKTNGIIVNYKPKLQFEIFMIVKKTKRVPYQE